MTSEERILQFSPYYFDASVEQIWLALSTGASLILVAEDILSDPNNLKTYIIEKEITHFHSTPSFLEIVNLADIPTLRRVVSIGEVCRPTLAQRISSQYPFYNEYGPTETTVTSTVQKIESVDDLAHKISIGRPIANTQAYILNNCMDLLPLGVIGELYLGGKGLSSGYLNRSDLTKERFVENPFGAGYLYKTGDLAKWNSDGSIAFIGRNDDQIKLHGIRIELGEIECHVNAIDGITDSVAMVKEVQGTRSLVAYYVSEESIATSEIRAGLIEKLPVSMIPSYYIHLQEIPLTPSGKISRRSLPFPETKEMAYKAPSNATEEQLQLFGLNY